MLAALADAVDDWLNGNCVDDLETVVDDRFDVLTGLCAGWLEGSPRRKQDERRQT
jgi:hypothetical protein